MSLTPVITHHNNNQEIVRFMKQLVSFILCLSCVLISAVTVHSKEKKITYAPNVTYLGEVENKEPSGPGVLSIVVSSSLELRLQGTFKNTEVDGILLFPDGSSAEGILSFEIGTAAGQYKAVTLNIHSGVLRTNKGRIFGKIQDESPETANASIISIITDSQYRKQNERCIGQISYAYVGDNPELLAWLSKLAGDTSYEIVYGDGYRFVFETNDDLNLTQYANPDSQKIENFDANFSNGYVANVRLQAVNSLGANFEADKIFLVQINKPNNEGAVLFGNQNDDTVTEEFQLAGHYVHCIGFDLALGESNINSSGRAHLVFANGNVFDGTIKKDIISSFLSKGQELISLKELPWTWAQFPAVAEEGKITYASDGSWYEGTLSASRTNGNKLSTKCYKKGALHSNNGTIIHTYVSGKDETELALYDTLKKNDYLEFQDENRVKAFRRTLPDLTVIEGKSTDHWWLFDEFRIYDKDSLVYEIKTHERLSDGDDRTFGVETGASYYKENIITLTSAPTLSNETLAKAGIWVFQDGFTFLSQTSPDPRKPGNGIIIRTPDSDNGDFAELFFEGKNNRVFVETASGGMGYYKTVTSYSENGFTGFRKTFTDCIVVAAKRTNSLFDGKSIYEGDVFFNNGQSYKGTFIIGTKNGENALQSDDRVLDLVLTVDYSLENIVSHAYVKGELLDAEGNLIAAFDQGKKLDEFDFARYVAQQNKIKEQKEAELRKAQEKEKEYQDKCNKYGKRFVDAALDGVILIGMPEELMRSTIATSLNYESETNRSYNVKNIFGDTVMIVTVSKSTHKVTFISDFR